MDTGATTRWFAVFRTTIFAGLFMGTVGIYLPRYFGLLSGGFHGDARLLGLVPFCLGTYIALRCAFAFGWTGRGTPAPWDPPRRLVVSGMYRYVRNPMYFGMALFLIGEWLLWGSDFRRALEYFAFFVVAVTLFVVLYEEPTLRRKFHDDYAEYSRSVPRFLPRLQPWEPQKTKGATQPESRLRSSR
jgi:protein-S-isoprenylcysteine O-methyltransferase Ste14